MINKNPLNLRMNYQGVEKVLPQTGKRISIKRDASRPAKLPGKRISKSGKTYWESRANRSDRPNSNL